MDNQQHSKPKQFVPATLVFFKTDPSKVVATVLISAGLIPVTRVGTVVFFSTITNYRLAKF